MYYAAIISDNSVTKNIASKFLSHFNPDIKSAVVTTGDEFIKLLENNELVDVLIIEHTPTSRFDDIIAFISRSNIDLPLILMSKECSPRLMSQAINEHVNNYLCIDERDPSDYYQELSNLIVFTVERFRVQSQHILETKRFAALVELAKKDQYDFQGIINYALEKAMELTSSKIGYVAMVNEPENQLTMLAWSQSAHDMCRVDNKQMDFKLNEAGLWAAPVRTGKAVYIDDYETTHHPMKHGAPTGHVELKRLLMVPIHLNGSIIGTVGVGNKMREYNSVDEYNVQQLFQEAFEIEQSTIIKNRYESDLAIFRHIFNSGPFGLMYLSKDGTKASLNSVAASLMNAQTDGNLDVSQLSGEIIQYVLARVKNYRDMDDDRIFTVDECKWSIAIHKFNDEGLQGYSIVLTDVTKILEYKVKVDSGEAIIRMMQCLIGNELRSVLTLISSPEKAEENRDIAIGKIEDVSRFLETFNGIDFNSKEWFDLSATVKEGFSLYNHEGLQENIRLDNIQIFANGSFYKIFYEFKRLVCIRCVDITVIEARYKIESGVLKILLSDDGLHPMSYGNNMSGPIYCDPLPTVLIKQLCNGNGMGVNWIPRNHGFIAEIQIPPDMYRIG
jgi:hypothetical protein